MFLSRFFDHSEIRSMRRPSAHRRPLLETLEGRQLLTTFLRPDAGHVGHQIGRDLSGIVGSHIGTNALIQGGHIGTNALIQGGHIGTSVSGTVVDMTGGAGTGKVKME